VLLHQLSDATKSAVSTDNAREAVERRRRQRTVPENLRVIVCVNVDEPGCDDAALSIDNPLCLFIRLPDHDYAAVAHTYISASPGPAFAVDHIAAPNQDVVHMHLLA
jgi:hypothetical protein